MIDYRDTSNDIHVLDPDDKQLALPFMEPGRTLCGELIDNVDTTWDFSEERFMPLNEFGELDDFIELWACEWCRAEWWRRWDDRNWLERYLYY